MKSNLRHRLEQFVLSRIMRRASQVARYLPLKALWVLADAGARVAMVLTPHRQKLAEVNLAASFPELSASERRRIRRNSVRNITRTMLETLKLPTLSKEDLEALIDTPDLEVLRRAHQAGDGVILISAHFGNWELLAAHVCHQIGPLTVVSRDGGHERKVKLIRDARAHHGVSMVNRRDTREMLRLLNSGGMLAMLPDQHAAEGGMRMEFLGREAWTFSGPALLAYRTGARVVAGFCVRAWDGRFRLELAPEIELIRTDDRAADIAENTRRINSAIEQAIRKYPDNWLWLHDRWKEPRSMAAEAKGMSVPG